MKHLLSRILRLFKKPVMLGVAGTIGIVVGIVFWGGFHTALEATNTEEFCISCHEMRDTVYQEYKESAHFQNPSGVRASCPDCHVPREWAPKMVRKFQAAGELYHKLVGTIDTPEKFEAHRLQLAKNEWARMKASDSRECRNCHAFEAMDFEHQSPKASKMMQKAMNEGGTCIDCHKGIAHKLPDMSAGFRSMFASLKSSVVTDPAVGDTLVALTTGELWSAREPAEAGKRADGRILPVTPVTVQAHEGDLIRVSIEGWQREGAERLVVASAGERIMEAALAAPFAAKADVQETVVDEALNQTWKRVTVDAWMPVENLVRDTPALSDYGAEMFSASCGACHTVPSFGHFTPTQWMGVIHDMKTYTGLTEEELRFLQSYVQYQALEARHEGS